MNIYFSPSTMGFYEVDHPAIPEDAVQITPARHRAMLDGQAAGATISVAPDGHPRLLRAAKSKVADRRARLVRMIKREAARRIKAVAPIWCQINDMRAPGNGSAARFATIDAIRAASNAIESEVTTLDAAGLDAFDIAQHPGWKIV